MAKDLRHFLAQLTREYPDDMVEVSRPVRPAEFEVTALLEHLDRRKLCPVVHFLAPANMHGDPSEFTLVSNVFGTRERCATALDFPREQAKMPLSIEFARRERMSLTAAAVTPDEAPVKDRVVLGQAVDIGLLPIVRHHEMDLSPVLTMTVVMRDPDDGFYDITFIKAFPQGPRRVGLAIHSPHLERILAKYEERGQRAPMVIVLGHHPAFYLGSLSLSPFGVNDYDAVGGFLGEPLRLVASETWGEDFMVPADAEIVIEGEIVPGERAIVNPFGEVTRHYQAQCLRPVAELTALTHREDAILQDIFAGHQGHWNLGGIPKEGSLYNVLNQRFGGIRAVHLPYSGCSRFSCYISMEKREEGKAKMLGMEALAQTKLMEAVVIVDEEIDPFNEPDVIWAVLTQTNTRRDVSVIYNAQSFFFSAMGSTKVIVDATRPLDMAFPEKIRVPREAMDRMKLEEWLDTAQLERR